MRSQTQAKYANIDKRVMVAISSNALGTTLVKIADATAIQPTTVWRSCQRLLKKGYISKASNGKTYTYRVRVRDYQRKPPEAPPEAPPAYLYAPTAAALLKPGEAVDVDTLPTKGAEALRAVQHLFTTICPGYTLKVVPVESVEPEVKYHNWASVGRVNDSKGRKLTIAYQCRNCAAHHVVIKDKPDTELPRTGSLQSVCLGKPV